MEKSFVFNSINKDRVYKAEDFASYFASFIGNGIFPNPACRLQVIDNNNMTVTVKEGKGWINGYYYQNTNDFILKLEPADSVLDRIDRVVLRLDFNKRAINLAIKKGEFSSNAETKKLQRDADAHEIALADIKISAGAISIKQADITDLRLSKELCGIVHGIVDQVDTTAIFNQFQSWYSDTQDSYDKDITLWTKEKKQAFDNWYSQNTQGFSKEFEGWFESLKDKLDGDVAAKLQKQLDELKEKVDTQYEEITQDITDLKTHVDNGKSSLYSAIVDKKVTPRGKDFADLTKAVKDIKLGQGNATENDVLEGKTFTNSTGIEQAGTMKNKGNLIINTSVNDKDYGKGYFDNVKLKGLINESDTNIQNIIQDVVNKKGNTFNETIVKKLLPNIKNKLNDIVNQIDPNFSNVKHLQTELNFGKDNDEIEISLNDTINIHNLVVFFSIDCLDGNFKDGDFKGVVINMGFPDISNIFQYVSIPNYQEYKKTTSLSHNLKIEINNTTSCYEYEGFSPCSVTLTESDHKPTYTAKKEIKFMKTKIKIENTDRFKYDYELNYKLRLEIFSF